MARARYKEHIARWPHRDCSAQAEYLIYELWLAQEHLSRKWETRTWPERQKLRAVLRWLRRCGVQKIVFEEVMPNLWEDIAVIVYLWQSPGMQRAFPSLTLELMD